MGLLKKTFFIDNDAADKIYMNYLDTLNAVTQELMEGYSSSEITLFYYETAMFLYALSDFSLVEAGRDDLRDYVGIKLIFPLLRTDALTGYVQKYYPDAGDIAAVALDHANILASLSCREIVPRNFWYVVTGNEDQNLTFYLMLMIGDFIFYPLFEKTGIFENYTSCPQPDVDMFEKLCFAKDVMTNIFTKAMSFRQFILSNVSHLESKGRFNDQSSLDSRIASYGIKNPYTGKNFESMSDFWQYAERYKQEQDSLI